MPPRQQQEPLGVLAHKLAAAMSYGYEVAVELRTRPVKTVRGPVTRREIDAGRKIDPKKQQSNLIYTVGGERVAVEQVKRVRRAVR